jgi:hypothetical protein
VLGPRKNPPTQRQPDAAPAAGFRLQTDADEVDRLILSALLFAPASGPWAITELVRETRRTPVEIDDSLWRLSRTGVIHRLADGFVILSRTAAHVAALLDPESDPASPNRPSPGRAATQRHPVNRYDRRPRLFPRRRRWLTYDAH